MKVLVLGAAGEPGRMVCEAALDAGHEVAAFVPAGAADAPWHEGLDVIEGDVLDQSAVEKAVVGRDAVVSALVVSHRRPTTLNSDAAAAAVLAMRANGLRRLVCLSSSWIDADGPGIGPARRLHLKLIIHRRHRNTLNDLERMEDELRLSELDWTVLRPAPLTDGPRTGRYRTGTGGHVPAGRSLSRADLAHFVVEHLDDAATYRQVVEIAY